jgi:hypothetical protein
MAERSESTEALERARAAFANGRIGPSVRHGWSAALAAIHERDAEQLGEVLVLARWVEEQASGRWRKRAGMLAAYCSAALAGGLEVESRAPWLGRLFAREQTKRCPDCAETVKAAARVCRFCGYRFDAGG